VTLRAIAAQMNEGFIFWEQALRATGPGSPATAVARLSSLLSAGRYRGGNRLTGVMDGSRFRIWRTSTLTTEVVECAGVIRAHGAGSIIEATLRYKLATRIQFAGGLLLGTVLAIGGTLQHLADAQPKSELAPVGFFILAAILVWIYSSSKMKKEQISYITERLEEIVAA
jgi:hypothetical protein